MLWCTCTAVCLWEPASLSVLHQTLRHSGNWAITFTSEGFRCKIPVLQTVRWQLSSQGWDERQWGLSEFLPEPSNYSVTAKWFHWHPILLPLTSSNQKNSYSIEQNEGDTQVGGKDSRKRKQQSPWLSMKARQEINSATCAMVIIATHAFHLLC